VIGLAILVAVFSLWRIYPNEVVVGAVGLITALGLRTSDWTRNSRILRSWGPWFAIVAAGGAIYFLFTKQIFPEKELANLLPPYWPLWTIGCIVLGFYPLSIARFLIAHPIRYAIIVVCLGAASFYGYSWYLGSLAS
jgi:hypothetical protein